MRKVFRQIKFFFDKKNLMECEKKSGKIDYKARLEVSLSEIKYQLMNYLFYSWYYPLDNFVGFIKKVVDYTPILWKDRDWDYCYMLLLLQHKLKRMEKHIDKYGIHTNKARDVKNIKIAVELLEQIIQDDFNKQAYDDHTKKWGHYSFGSKVKTGLSRTKIKTKKDVEVERAEFDLLWKEENRLRKEVTNEFFSHIKKHFRSWWD